MSASKPLQGAELISCAKANAKSGVADAANQCGYGNDIATFERTLKETCDRMGMDIESLGDLVSDQQRTIEQGMVEIAPDSYDEL
ncbi:MAG: hypothetical protein VKK04_08885 [Synechococcales bacterium]|nr:hypothetical protein [Synechococcales bacterium]